MATAAWDRTAPLQTLRQASWLIGGLTAYFAAQILLRPFYVSALSLDDAEMMVISQELRLGYGPQPPLFNWLQIGVFKVAGVSFFSIGLLHFALLWLAFLAMFQSARLVLADDRKAAVVTLGLFAIPQLSWDSQYSHTHTVIALTLAAVSLAVFLQLLKHGRWLDYLALGVCLALGMLSKYNYAVFATALFLAAVSMPSFRWRVLSFRMLLSLALAAALFAPHLWWFVEHMEAGMTWTSKLKLAGTGGVEAGRLRALTASLGSLFGYAVLTIVVVFFAAFVPLRRREPDTIPDPGTEQREFRVLVGRLISIATVILILGMLVVGATQVKQRWLLPILFPLPLWLFILLENRFTPVRQRVLGIVCGGLALLFLAALVGLHFLPAPPNGQLRSAGRFDLLAAEIRALGFREGYILADNRYRGGNLKLYFPTSTVAEPQFGLWPTTGSIPDQLLIAWEDGSPPGRLERLYRRLCGDAAGPIPHGMRLSAPFAQKSKQLVLSVAILPMCSPSALPERDANEQSL